MVGLRELFRSGYRYPKVSVMLGQITDAGAQQQGLFDQPDDPKRTRLMSLMDQINQAQGRGTLHFASMDLDDAWHMRTGSRSRRYTICWEELSVAYCYQKGIFRLEKDRFFTKPKASYSTGDKLA